MDTPLVTAIVPSYNHARWVRQAIESIASQSYPNVELLVIDDGSSDGSPAILAALAAEFRFALQLQSNRGVTATMNSLLRNARGKYIVPCGSDDAMLPGRIAKQVAVLEADDRAVLCHGDAVEIDADGRRVGRNGPPASAPMRWDAARYFANSIYMVAPTVCFRREAIEREGFLDENLPTEDAQLFVKLLRHGDFVRIPEPVLARRIHGANLSLDAAHLDRSRWALYATLTPEERRLAEPYYELNAFASLSRSHKRDALTHLVPTLRAGGFRDRRFWYGLYCLALKR